MSNGQPGRPREFEINEVLDAAIGLFWSKGYDGTSLTDLTEAMGITRPSLYAAFGDKHGLYLRAIERYSTKTECPPLAAFDAQPNIEKAVRAFLSASIDYLTQQGDGQLGCFLGNCVATNAHQCEDVQQRLRYAIKETDLRLAARFDLEKKNSKLRKDFPSKDRARLMFDLRQGFALRARAGIAARTMKADLKQRVAMVLS